MYNEESVVTELHQRVGAVLNDIAGGPHEIVFVDDGSSDLTLEHLENAAREDDRVVLISLSRNLGHQAALTAALDHVTGDVTVVMDGDLQDPPEAIPEFLEKYQQGYDVVYGRRVGRKESWWLRSCYFAFYRLLTRLSEVPLPVDVGDFCLMSRRVVEHIRRSREHQRYLRGLRSWVGFKQTGIAVQRSERWSGESKYSAVGLVRLALDGIFAFSIVPLRAAALLGAASVGLATVFAMYSLYAKLFLEQSPKGFTALILIIWFLSGVHLFFLGVIGEYVGRVYEEAKGRPLYVVDKMIRRETGTADIDTTGSGATRIGAVGDSTAASGSE
ncbi:MAG: glycosyltransferase family 2 protein [Gemmatimonadota bacterium]|nr:MAG: glycosyltransferase family 2 protein [Gemmatimonadota bacterium]